jgi:hypothetical protein
MAERPRISDFGFLNPLSIRDRLRGERMCAASQTDSSIASMAATP